MTKEEKNGARFKNSTLLFLTNLSKKAIIERKDVKE